LLESATGNVLLEFVRSFLNNLLPDFYTAAGMTFYCLI